MRTGEVDMSFYVSHSEIKLIVGLDGFDEKRARILEIAGGGEGELFSSVPSLQEAEASWRENLVFDEVATSRFDGPWPEGMQSNSLDDDVRYVLELCEDGSYVEYFNDDEFMFVRAERRCGDVSSIFSEPLPYWRL